MVINIISVHGQKDVLRYIALHSEIHMLLYKEALLPYISYLVTGSYILNNFRLKQTEEVSNSTTAEESWCSYEAFGSAHEKLIGAAWLGLPSQCKLQISSQPKSFKTERDKHFSRLFLLVQALSCGTEISPPVFYW